MKVTLVTLDGHLASAAERAFADLSRAAPGLSCSLHCAGEWAADEEAVERCRADILEADIVIVCMLFMEDHFKAVMPALRARRDHCDAILCFMSAGEVMKLTRMGRFAMSGGQPGPLALLRRLRGAKPKQSGSSGARQLAMLRRLPRILRFIPGTAQDVRAYFLGMQYWLAGSEKNIRNMIALMVSRYASGPRRHFGETIDVADPVEYPEVGVYHPRMRGRISDRLAALPAGDAAAPRVGLLLMRSYVLAGNTLHYDAVIEALESKGMRVIPAFSTGLDARPAVEKFFSKDGKSRVEAVVSLTGFSLVGGPAYNDASAAESMMQGLDVPCFAAHGTEFQSLESWESSASGLLPVETTMMVAIPELDGAISPTIFAGRLQDGAGTGTGREMHPQRERIAMLAGRVARFVRLRQVPRSERRIGIVLFNFPPNSGATGTAAHLSVFRSLFNTLKGLAASGYRVDLPADVEELRSMLLEGNAGRYGAAANVHARIGVDDYVRRQPWLAEIEKEWGPAPGREQSDGASLFVLGRQFGNVLVGVQPAFGYEGDPMRLLFESGFAPTHAFAGFYRYLSEEFGANALLHFGTHGALEFMPGKQTGLSGKCWPDRLIGDMPNFYLYAANNPSEGMIAKRRSGATLISYLTPTVTKAGLYRQFGELQSAIDRWRALPPSAKGESEKLAVMIRSQAAELELPGPGAGTADGDVAAIAAGLDEMRDALIPDGLHVVGEAVPQEQRVEFLAALAKAADTADKSEEQISALAAAVVRDGAANDSGAIGEADSELLQRLSTVNRHLANDSELAAIVHALDGGFVPPVAGGDLLRSTDILPTGRNIHGFDPLRMPTAFAAAAGAAQAEELLERYRNDNEGRLPESVALVLWGTDNIKSEGGPVAQALRLFGARPRFDAYGRLAGAELIPLAELGRPRVDVVMTLSGIFRDLLPNQTRMLAEAAWLAASADEAPDQNFVRKHVLACQADTGCDFEAAALRAFSNAEGAYGSNVNMLIDNGRWNDSDELAEQFSSRKCYAYGRNGVAQRQSEVLARTLADVDCAYQNLESAELGITSIDHYFDTLGGVSRAVKRARGDDVEVYVGDQTREVNTIRTLSDQVALETRSRMLNPKWYEGMLAHGYEGVRQIESHVTNTMGWSATTGKVAPWVYREISQTFVLDDAMRRRLAQLNPRACANVANRLLEAHERRFWSPDPDTLAALEKAGEELEDYLEGATEVVAA